MEIINIQAIPNQKLSVRLDNNLYQITIKECNGCMCATVVCNGITIVTNSRLVGNTPLIPYRYLENDSGNFIIGTDLEEIPYYTQFGVTQQLIYASAAELIEFRA